MVSYQLFSQMALFLLSILAYGNISATYCGIWSPCLLSILLYSSSCATLICGVISASSSGIRQHLGYLSWCMVAFLLPFLLYGNTCAIQSDVWSHCFSLFSDILIVTYLLSVWIYGNISTIYAEIWYHFCFLFRVFILAYANLYAIMIYGYISVMFPAIWYHLC